MPISGFFMIAFTEEELHRGFKNAQICSYKSDALAKIGRDIICIVQFIIENGKIMSLAVALLPANAAMIINRASEKVFSHRGRGK